MRFKIVGFLFFSSVLLSCGTGGSSDTGVSTLIEATDVEPTYMTIDLVQKLDNDNQGDCTGYYIPLGDTVQITFKSVIPDNINIQPSDVQITSYTVEFRAKTNSSIPIIRETYRTICLIPAGQTKSCSFPLFEKNKKITFYRNRWFDDFDITITVHGKEVIYDKSIDIGNISLTARISDIQEANEPNCTLNIP